MPAPVLDITPRVDSQRADTLSTSARATSLAPDNDRRNLLQNGLVERDRAASLQLQKEISPSIAQEQLSDIAGALKSSGNIQGLNRLNQLLNSPGAVNALDLNRTGANATLISHIHRLATAQVPASQVQAHQEIVNSLLEHLANPDVIHQDGTATCTITVIQRGLAGGCPAEYARITTDLFLNGRTTLADGKTEIYRDKNYLTRQDASDDKLHGKRDRLELLIQDALMHKGANLEGGSYDAASDTISRAGGIVETGLHKSAYQFMYNATFNKDTRLLSVEQGISKSVLTDKVLGPSTAADRLFERAVPVELALRGPNSDAHALHLVSVTGTVTINGEQYVRIFNPWGLSTGADGSSQAATYNARYQHRYGDSWKAVDAVTGDPSAGKFELIKRSDFENMISASIQETGLDASKSALTEAEVLKRLPTVEELKTYPVSPNGVIQIQIPTPKSSQTNQTNNLINKPELEVSMSIADLNAKLAEAEQNQRVRSAYDELARKYYEEVARARKATGFDSLSQLATEHNSRQKQDDGNGGIYLFSLTTTKPGLN
jgi:hypothetical protein